MQEDQATFKIKIEYKSLIVTIKIAFTVKNPIQPSLLKSNNILQASHA